MLYGVVLRGVFLCMGVLLLSCSGGGDSSGSGGPKETVTSSAPAATDDNSLKLYTITDTGVQQSVGNSVVFNYVYNCNNNNESTGDLNCELSTGESQLLNFGISFQGSYFHIAPLLHLSAFKELASQYLNRDQQGKFRFEVTLDLEALRDFEAVDENRNNYGVADFRELLSSVTSGNKTITLAYSPAWQKIFFGGTELSLTEFVARDPRRLSGIKISPIATSSVFFSRNSSNVCAIDPNDDTQCGSTDCYHAAPWCTLREGLTASVDCQWHEWTWYRWSNFCECVCITGSNNDNPFR